MIKVTFKMIAALDVASFNETVNQHLNNGWKFMNGMTVLITDHEDSRGRGYQYSIAMLLEEEQ